MNIKYIQRAKSYLREAFDNLEGQMKYRFLEQKVTFADKHPNRLIDPYFTKLSNGDSCANNGWILNANPEENFVES